MLRKVFLLTAVFAAGVLATLVLESGVPPRAFAQANQGNNSDLAKRVQALEARLAALDAQQSSNANSRLQPVREQPPLQQGSNPPVPPRDKAPDNWDSVNRRLTRLEYDSQSLNQRVSSLEQTAQTLAKLASVPDALAKLQSRFDNHYHSLVVPGHVAMAIEPILNCPGYVGGQCTSASGDKSIVVPVVKGNSPGGFEQTSGPKVP